MIRPIHPFPARMAPDLAISELTSLKRGSVVLDPMAGSGTVLRQASENGLTAIGFDVDPMAVLISRVARRRKCESRRRTPAHVCRRRDR